MDPQWQMYTDSSANRAGQFGNGFGGQRSQVAPQSQLAPGSGAQPQQPQAPLGYSYENPQALGAAPTTSKATPSNTAAKSVSVASSPSATPLTQDYLPDPDTLMEDADPYNRAKYPSARTSRQLNRGSSQHISGDESSASRRYSPMNVLSPSLPYHPSPNASQNPHAFGRASASSRASPTSNTFSSPPCTFLPTLLSLFSALLELYLTLLDGHVTIHHFPSISLLLFV